MVQEAKSNHAHFKEKDALGHVAEAKARGLLSSTEVHGTEIPGHWSAGADAAKETALGLLILWILLQQLKVVDLSTFWILAVFSLGWMIWKGGRSAWLGWSRLERMHRIVGQEKWEIDHHRQQEREELKELYASKGFEGKLLEDVLDVLMADDERLLRVMVEEELCLTLESHEHPLKQGLGAAFGVLIAALLCLIGFWLVPVFGIWTASFIVIGFAAAIAAYFEDNEIIPAIVWNVGLCALTAGSVQFMLDYLRGIL